MAVLQGSVWLAEFHYSWVWLWVFGSSLAGAGREAVSLLQWKIKKCSCSALHCPWSNEIWIKAGFSWLWNVPVCLKTVNFSVRKTDPCVWFLLFFFFHFVIILSCFISLFTRLTQLQFLPSKFVPQQYVCVSKYRQWYVLKVSSAQNLIEDLDRGSRPYRFPVLHLQESTCWEQCTHLCKEKDPLMCY